MNQEQIREILNNFNNLKWDSENYNNFVAHVRALNVDTLDDDLKLKVTTFLNDAANAKGLEGIGNQNNAIDNIEKQALTSENINDYQNINTPSLEPNKPVEEPLTSPTDINIVDGLNQAQAPTDMNVADGLNSTPNDININDGLNQVQAPTDMNVSGGLNPTPNDININDGLNQNQQSPNLNSQVQPTLTSEPVVMQPNEGTPINQPPTNIGGNQNFNEQEPKEKKKTNIILVIILVVILIAAIVAGLFYAGIIKLPTKDNNVPANKNNNTDIKENLVCTLNEDDAAYNVNVVTNLLVDFDEEEKANTMNYEITYTFTSVEDYQLWKNDFEESSVDDENKPILDFNEEELIIKSTMSIAITDYSDFPTDYNGLRNYLIDLGHSCNGEETATNVDVADVDQTKDGKYSITDKIDASNNLFSYQQLYFDEVNETSTSAVGWVTSLVNNSGQGQLLNIKLKLYDQEKIEIGEFMLIPEQEVSETSMFYIAPEETKDMNFNITDDHLNEGKTIQDIKYFSIEDL